MEKSTAVVREAEAQPSSRDIAKLEESFRIFNQMTGDLERAYDKLTRKASRIDIELRRTNGELARKVAELEAVTRRLEGILRALPSGVVVLDEDGLITAVNPAAERILGRRAGELVGRSGEATVGPTGDPLLMSREERAAGALERDATTLDGARRRISITTATLPEGSELQVLTDLTVLTRLREQVGRLDDLASLGEMAATVAHEVRNPLNGIDGFAGLLERTLPTDDDTGTARRYVGNIRRGVREVNDIVTHLLAFAALDQVQLGPASPGALLDEVAAQLRAQLGSDDVKIELHGDAAAREATLDLDVVKIKMVLVNLVKNAVEAVDGSGSVDLGIALDRRAGRCTLTVQDSGPGIAPGIRNRLFRPFTTTKSRGTGLGLAIARKFVELHGGRIACSDARPGARFTVTLPLPKKETASK